jgi:hypothetical protein
VNDTRVVRWLCAAALAVTLAACSGGYQRGIFTGYVVDATDEEIKSKVGNPDEIDSKDPAAIKFVYKKKTFDPDNMNKTDEKTIVVLKKDPASGKWKGSEVLFL